jgi:hypothetical protein
MGPTQWGQVGGAVHREPDLVTLLPREVEELGENLQSWCVEHLFPSNGWDLATIRRNQNSPGPALCHPGMGHWLFTVGGLSLGRKKGNLGASDQKKIW